MTKAPHCGAQPGWRRNALPGTPAAWTARGMSRHRAAQHAALAPGDQAIDFSAAARRLLCRAAAFLWMIFLSAILSITLVDAT